VQRNFESTDDFMVALAQEEQRQQQNWWWGFQYCQSGFYYQQLQRYFEHFDRSQIKICLYQDLQTSLPTFCQEMFDFIGVDSGFVPNTQTRYNATGIPKNPHWHQFLEKGSLLKTLCKPFIPAKWRDHLLTELKNRNLDKPPVPLPAKLRLQQIYREDILKLQDMLNRDLSDWLI
jgi:hypothetical protein